MVQCGDYEDKGDIKFGKVGCHEWFHHSCVAHSPSDYGTNRVFICSACTEGALLMLLSTVKKILGAGGILKNILQD
jgi:hypothetical protein